MGIFNWLSGKSEINETQAVEALALRLVDIIRSSAKMAKESKNKETQRSRINLAKEKLEELKSLASQYEYLTIKNLPAFEADLEDVENSIEQHNNKSKLVTGNYIRVSKADNDIVKGYKFSAAMCLKTPLEGLNHHNEIKNTPVKKLPIYCDVRYGTWLPITKTFSELNNNPDIQQKLEQIGECEHLKMIWSDIGEITDDGSNYIHFLRKFRTIVESDLSPIQKSEQIAGLGVVDNCNYQQYLDAHQSKNIDWKDEYLGYETILGIEGIGIKIAKSIYESGIVSKGMLKQADNSFILKIKGVGKAKVMKIRELLK